MTQTTRGKDKINMKIDSQIAKITSFQQLELLANQIVEGFISGMHKSPFHGFSAEFAEHKVYNAGESTKHIDWKLFAKTDRLYTKKFEEETNLRCHLIIDNSSSMHYPKLKETQLFVQLPNNQRDVYNAQSETFIPNFDEKVAQYLTSCPPVANKIKAKDKDFFYAFINQGAPKRKQIWMNIINEFNNCK